MKKIGLLIFFLSLSTITLATAQESPFSLSGYVFGDFYYVATHHGESLEAENGFWIRRAYFTVDKGLEESFDIRFRLEMNSPGDFTTVTKLNPFVKDAYVRWKNENYQILLGISPSPTWEFIEGFWGYRSLEKTPADLYRMGSSREFGVAFRGGSKTVKFHLMVGNGAGESSEINQGKAVLGSILFNLTDSVSAEFYADYNSLPAEVDRSTLQGFLGWQKRSAKVGLQYIHQQIDTPAGDRNLDVLSVLGVYKVNERLSFIGRFDRQFDPNPEGEKIPYIPFAANAKSNFFLVALDFSVIKNVFLQPNIEAVIYDKTETVLKPDSDLIPRITLYYKF